MTGRFSVFFSWAARVKLNEPVMTVLPSMTMTFVMGGVGGVDPHGEALARRLAEE
jgi:hypothetical protein